ncbi:MAG: RNA-binding protein [Thermoplasmata archaeon]|nr:RNA-binding protein [Thermoplasmata archaeon]
MNPTNVSNNDRKFVLPGDLLGDEKFRSGSGTYGRDGKIYASRIGILNISRDFINVIPFSGAYVPKPGDSVIGKVIDNGPSSWMVSIHSPYIALLHTNDVQPNIKYGETGKFLKAGDTVLAKISNINEIKKIQLTMKEHGLRKLDDGQVIHIPHSKVPRVIGKGGSMISLLKQNTDTKMFVGQNGAIWIDGEPGDIERVSKAIRMIDERTQMSGLTDMVREYLEGHENNEDRDDTEEG